MSWPSGVPARRRRPENKDSALALLGAIAGGVFVRNTILGALIGGLIGSAFSNTGKAPLQNAIVSFAKACNLELVSFRRPSRRSVAVILRVRDEYFSFLSTAPNHSDLTDEDIEDWLFGDVVEYGFKAAISALEKK